jgi:hypothetical protein
MAEPNGMKAHELKGTPNGAKLAAAKAIGARTTGRQNGPSARLDEAAPAHSSQPAEASPAPAHFDPSMLTLPYLEMSRALLRAHHNALAMMEANRTLTDSLRAILRRQQDLAFELAEQVMNGSGAHSAGAASRDEGGAVDRHETVFHRAAEAVRELGEAMIAAQLNALDTLRDRTRGDGGGGPPLG